MLDLQKDPIQDVDQVVNCNKIQSAKKRTLCGEHYDIRRLEWTGNGRENSQEE